MQRRKVLGIGAASATMLVEDTEANELRVLKRLNISGWDPQESKRMSTALLHMAQLTETSDLSAPDRSPLIAVFNVTVQNAFINVVSEYFPEGDLTGELIRRGDPVTDAECLSWFLRLVSALKDVYLLEIPHCGLDLDRIFLREGKVFLGLPFAARVYKARVDSAISCGNSTQFPPEYAAAMEANRALGSPQLPEPSLASDVWHLGKAFRCILDHRDGLNRANSPTRSALAELASAMCADDPGRRPSLEALMERLLTIRAATPKKSRKEKSSKEASLSPPKGGPAQMSTETALQEAIEHLRNRSSVPAGQSSPSDRQGSTQRPSAPVGQHHELLTPALAQPSPSHQEPAPELADRTSPLRERLAGGGGSRPKRNVTRESLEWEERMAQHLQELEGFQQTAAVQPKPKVAADLLSGESSAAAMQRRRLGAFARSATATEQRHQDPEDVVPPPARHHSTLDRPQVPLQASKKPDRAPLQIPVESVRRERSISPTSSPHLSQGQQGKGASPAEFRSPLTPADATGAFVNHTTMRTMGRHDRLRAIEDNNTLLEKRKEEFARQRMEKEIMRKQEMEDAQERRRQHRLQMQQIKNSRGDVSKRKEFLQKFSQQQEQEGELAGAAEGIHIYCKGVATIEAKPPTLRHKKPNHLPPREESHAAMAHGYPLATGSPGTKSKSTPSTSGHNSPDRSREKQSPEKGYSPMGGTDHSSNGRDRYEEGREVELVTELYSEDPSHPHTAYIARLRSDIEPPSTPPKQAQRGRPDSYTEDELDVPASSKPQFKSPSIERPSQQAPIPTTLHVAGYPTPVTLRAQVEPDLEHSSRPVSHQPTVTKPLRSSVVAPMHRQDTDVSGSLTAVSVIEWQAENLINGLRKLMDPPVVEDVLVLVRSYGKGSTLSHTLPRSNAEFTDRVAAAIGDDSVVGAALPLVFQLVALEATVKLCENLQQNRAM